MTFDTIKMQKKYQEAGFDLDQSRALVEGQQEARSELATRADVKAIVTEQAQQTDKAIADLKVYVAEQNRLTLMAMMAIVSLAVAVIKLF